MGTALRGMLTVNKRIILFGVGVRAVRESTFKIIFLNPDDGISQRAISIDVVFKQIEQAVFGLHTLPVKHNG